MWKHLTTRLADRMKQVFVPRELILRAHDRVTVLRLTVRIQKFCLLGVFFLVAWTLLASGGFVIQEFVIAGKDREIQRQNLDYFDLLSGVSEFHDQFARVTQDLEQNQVLLLSVLKDGGQAEAQVSAIEEELRASETERDRIIVARDDLRSKLAFFEKELRSMVKNNHEMHAQLERMQSGLSDPEVDHRDVAKARTRLGHRLEQVEGELSAMTAMKRQLENSVSELQSQVVVARQEWAAANTVSAHLREEIYVLQSHLEEAAKRQDGLQRQQAELEYSLENSTHRGNILHADKQALQSEVAGLRQRMVDMRAAQRNIVQRLRERTELGVDSIERTVAMTGLKLDEILAGIEGDIGQSQGGPFLAGDYTGDFDGDSELEIALSLLDLRLSRWNALQRVMRTLPLTVPLDQYSVSSGYGKRKDPMNGRIANHRGLDFRAPMRAPIYSTAPGTVTYAGWSGPFGRMIEIDHGHGIRTRYAHLKKILVKSGQSVANREKIGLVGSSGRSTGPHLHYEVRYNGVPLNPMKFLTAGKHVFKD